MKMKPTESELSILNVLWKQGPSTVRQVNEILNRQKRVGYTTTLKMMQIMHEKGMLERDEATRSHVYSPNIHPEDLRGNMLSQLVNTVFDGSTSKMLIHALGNYEPSSQEIEAIKELIRKKEQDGKSD